MVRKDKVDKMLILKMLRERSRNFFIVKIGVGEEIKVRKKVFGNTV